MGCYRMHPRKHPVGLKGVSHHGTIKLSTALWQTLTVDVFLIKQGKEHF